MSQMDEALAILDAPDVERLKQDGDIDGLIEALHFYARENPLEKFVASASLASLLEDWEAQADAVRDDAPAAVHGPYEWIPDVCVDVRKQAAEALTELGGPRAIEALCEALTDPSWNVRSSASSGLGEIGDAPAARALRKYAESEGDDFTKRDFARAAEKIESRE